MSLLAAVMLVAATAPPKRHSNSDYSRRVTAAAEELLVAEKKAVQKWRDAALDLNYGEDGGETIDTLVYQDVITLLEEALQADAHNGHARVVVADVLMTEADTGEGVFDVCTLLDARDQVSWVIEHSSEASKADLQKARSILKTISEIPPSSTTGSQSDCGDDDGSAGTSTIAAAR